MASVSCVSCVSCAVLSRWGFLSSNSHLNFTLYPPLISLDGSHTVKHNTELHYFLPMLLACNFYPVEHIGVRCSLFFLHFQAQAPLLYKSIEQLF